MLLDNLVQMEDKDQGDLEVNKENEAKTANQDPKADQVRSQEIVCLNESHFETLRYIAFL